mgnify:CR=1 FL=1
MKITERALAEWKKQIIVFKNVLDSFQLRENDTKSVRDFSVISRFMFTRLCTVESFNSLTFDFQLIQSYGEVMEDKLAL